MLSLANLIKTGGSICLILTLNSCAITKKDDINRLKDANRGLMISIDIDKEVYTKAMTSEFTPTTKELYKATLLKVGLINFFEKQIGVHYKLEDDLSIDEINSLCLMGNFLKAYEKYKPKQIDESEKYSWIDKKQQIWKAQLKEHFGARMLDNDCRKPY